MGFMIFDEWVWGWALVGLMEFITLVLGLTDEEVLAPTPSKIRCLL